MPSLNAPTANLVAEYTAEPGCALRPATELTLTMSATLRGALLAASTKYGNAIFVQFNVGVASGAYQSMFYAIVGTLTVLIVSGLVFTVASLFKSIGGRAANTDLLNAHALYWYFLTASFVAMWFVVYVQK